jgi:hypothetical protein
MIEYCLAGIICAQYKQIAEEWNSAKFNSKALRVNFRLHGGDSHYITMSLLIFGEMNYIGVWVQFITSPAVEGMEGTVTDCACLSYHDSCWRDAVKDVIFKHRKVICYVDDLFQDTWYKMVDVDPDLLSTLTEAKKWKYDA